MSKVQRRWSREEDALLREVTDLQLAAHDGHIKDWNEVAKKIPGRNNKDCRKRFMNEVQGGLKKGVWTKGEDALLETYVSRHGPSWAVISQKMGQRSADQCSKRWKHYLDPSLDHSTFSNQENITLLLAVQTHGTGWTDIQRLHFPLRSTNSVKNMYTILKNKNLSIPPGAAPCCPPVAGTKDTTLNSEQSPLDSDFAEFLERNNPANIDLPDLGAFHDVSSMPLKTYHPDAEPFSLSSAEADQFLLHSSFAPFPCTTFDSASHALDGDGPKSSSNGDFFDWIMGASGLETDITALGPAEERPQLTLSHDLTSEPVESPLASSPPREKDAMQIDDRPDADLAGSSTSGGTSPRGARSRRTTITIENIASETLVEVMQVLINAKAKFRFETE